LNPVVEKFWAHQVGDLAEARAEKHAVSLGVKIVARRVRVAGVELDLVGTNPAGAWIVIEVKSLGPGEWIENRISVKQKRRLVRAATALADGWRLPGVRFQSPDVELWLALVPFGPAPVQLIQDFA
jgi:Holliday junction resolvase-like predicted endonuclease